MPAVEKKSSPVAPTWTGVTLFTALAAIFLFVAVLKFGSPVILDDKITPPQGATAVVLESWPTLWGYWMLAPVLVAGLAAFRWNPTGFRWALILPLIWLGWQFLSATQTVNPRLTLMTLRHFSTCCALFYLGCFALRGNMWPLWTALALALCWAMRAGFEQHFGGLEATRHFIYQMKDQSDLPPGLMNDPAYQRRIASTRIFGTFGGNPDALAGAIELIMPLTLVFLWRITPKVRTQIRWLFVAILGGCGLACLYWTQSKAGCLVALLMGLFAVWRSCLSVKCKWLAICSILVLGAAGFGFRFVATASQAKQKASVTTRYAYWRAALKLAARRPVLGGGPGTFSALYPTVQRPGDDFARLCHNDYLEQACDSGIPGAIAYLAMIVTLISYLYRYRLTNNMDFSPIFAAWLGVAGLCLHSFVDYQLYVPALAWPMFFLLGFCVKMTN